MERFNTDGLVLKTSPTAEADAVLFILTRSRGVIRAFAKGARSTKSRLHAAACQFAYCDFSVNEKNGVFYVNEAAVRDIFYNLRTDLESLTLAQYFCELLLKTLPEGAAEEAFLRLLLNSLYLLAHQKKPAPLVKAVFELRTVSLLGYMPELVACKTCGCYQTDVMYFNRLTGALYCADCAELNSPDAIPVSVVNAMRHIVFSEAEKCFAFTLPPTQLRTLSELTGSYTETCFHRKFALSDYLRRSFGDEHEQVPSLTDECK